MEKSGEQVLQNIVSEFLSPLYQLVVALAFIYFLYGLAKFIYDMNHPSEKNVGKSHLVWGTIGLFIILSVGGILRVFGNIFGGLFIY